MQFEQESPGRWVNRDWKPRSGGAFALLIGVSAYPHLCGAETYDLEPLYVSALTAYRVFEWLRQDYARKGCPLAKCWLLLAPTEQELAEVPGMRGTYGDVTFNHVKLAIQEWTQTMKAQGHGAIDSRGFFFFSGHGIEVRSDHQVLLPSDYLAPPNPSLNDAISTNNLFRGLLCDPVPLHLLFIDACRNDHDALVAENITGAQILNTGGRRNTGVIVDLLRATASGFQAWQPKTPAKGESVFGRALLEGLKNRALKECDVTNCWIPMYGLQKFVNRRVMEILKSYNALVESPVRLGGEVDDAVVTEVAVSSPPSGRSSGGPSSPPESAGPTPPTADPSAIVDAALTHRATFVEWCPPVAPMPQLLTINHDVRTPHDVFGSEAMEQLWQTARVYDLARRAWLPAASGFALHQFAYDDAHRLFRAVVSIPAADGPCGLELRQLPVPSSGDGSAQPRTFTCMLPWDGWGPLRYSFLMTLEYGRNDPRASASQGLANTGRAAPFRSLSRVEVDIAPDNDGPVGLAASIWQRYRRGGARDAVTSAPFNDLWEKEGGGSPLAALLLATMIAPFRRAAESRFTEGLAQRASSLPDGIVLHAHGWWRRQRLESVGYFQALDWVRRMAATGMPLTSEALSIACGLIEDQLAVLTPPHDFAIPIERVQDRLLTLVRSSRSGGGFCSVFADLEELGLLEPTPRTDLSSSGNSRRVEDALEAVREQSLEM